MKMMSEWDVLLSKEIILSKEEAEAKTSVWWDMKSFPVPSGYDAGRVAECIKRSLEKSGFRGPVTITAYGDLQQTPEHVLRALSSTGITLNHSYSNYFNIRCDMGYWRIDNTPPATFMCITPGGEFGPTHYLPHQKIKGYNVLVNYEWKKLLEGATTVSESSKCSIVSGDESAPASCFCRLCHLTPGPLSVESFISHRSSKEHLEEIEEFQRLDKIWEDRRRREDEEMLMKSFGLGDDDDDSLDSHPETATTSMVMEQPKKKLKTMKKCTTIPPPKTLVEANKAKKKLKKKKKKEKKMMMMT